MTAVAEFDNDIQALLGRHRRVVARVGMLAALLSVPVAGTALVGASILQRVGHAGFTSDRRAKGPDI